MTSLKFPTAPADKKALEEGDVFAPRFDASGLVTAVVTDAGDGLLLMVAHMNAEARGCLWKKGETSGNFQEVVEMRTDCDQDAVWLRVKVAGDNATCHTGRRSCFYRAVDVESDIATLRKDGSKQQFDV